MHARGQRLVRLFLAFQLSLVLIAPGTVRPAYSAPAPRPAQEQTTTTEPATGVTRTTDENGTVTEVDPRTGLTRTIQSDGTTSIAANSAPEQPAQGKTDAAGTTTWTGQDGANYTMDKTGKTTRVDPANGTTLVTDPNLIGTSTDPATGVKRTTNQFGTVTEVDPRTGLTRTIQSDGTTSIAANSAPEQPAQGKTDAAGTTTWTGQDGANYTMDKTGKTTRVDPANGTTLVTDPNLIGTSTDPATGVKRTTNQFGTVTEVDPRTGLTRTIQSDGTTSIAANSAPEQPAQGKTDAAGTTTWTGQDGANYTMDKTGKTTRVDPANGTTLVTDPNLIGTSTDPATGVKRTTNQFGTVTEVDPRTGLTRTIQSDGTTSIAANSAPEQPAQGKTDAAGTTTWTGQDGANYTMDKTGKITRVDPANGTTLVTDPNLSGAAPAKPADTATQSTGSPPALTALSPEAQTLIANTATNGSPIQNADADSCVAAATASGMAFGTAITVCAEIADYTKKLAEQAAADAAKQAAGPAPLDCPTQGTRPYLRNWLRQDDGTDSLTQSPVIDPACDTAPAGGTGAPAAAGSTGPAAPTADTSESDDMGNDNESDDDNDNESDDDNDNERDDDNEGSGGTHKKKDKHKGDGGMICWCP